MVQNPWIKSVANCTNATTWNHWWLFCSDFQPPYTTLHNPCLPVPACQGQELQDLPPLLPPVAIGLGGSDRKQQQGVSSSSEWFLCSVFMENYQSNKLTWTVVVWRFPKGQVAEVMWAASGLAANCSGLQYQRWSGKWGCLNRDTPGSAFASDKYIIPTVYIYI